jgi:small-conductance mechanosensitive channel
MAEALAEAASITKAIRMEAFQKTFTALRNALTGMPGEIGGIIILAIAGIIALSVHRTIVRLINYLLGERHPFIRSYLARTIGLTRVAIFVLALFAALPFAPFDDEAVWFIAKFLALATIVLAGWAAIMATDVAADIYLMRFRLDVADNLIARKHVTQVRILRRAINVVVLLVTIGAALMTSESVREFGVSLFASAGVAGLVVGLAARPVLSNLIAGLQLAITQPIRIDDFVVLEGEAGTIEEITSTYVVVRLWDLRRMIVPLTYFIEKAFQNWTREGSALIGSVFLHLDYTAPVEAIRARAREIASQSKLWDEKILNVQVTDAKDQTIEVRIIAGAFSGSAAWDLRCELREKLIDFLQQEHPSALPRRRQEAVAQQARQ